MLKKAALAVLGFALIFNTPINAVTSENTPVVADWVLAPAELKKVDPIALEKALGDWQNAPGLRRNATLVIMDAVDGEILYQLNPNNLQTPASVTKLFTAVTVASLIDPDSQIVTRVKLLDDTVYLVGAGDPQFGARKTDGRVNLEALAELAAADLKKRNINIVKVVIDDSIFEPLQVPKDWLPSYLAASEAHPITALNLDDPTAPRQAPKDPSLVTGEKFANFLRAQSISVTTRVTRDKTPLAAQEIAQMKSKSMAQIIEDTLYTSNNQDTEILARLAAAVARETSDTNTTTNLINEVSASWGIDATALDLRDASGLSRTNKISSLNAATVSQKILFPQAPVNLAVPKNTISLTQPPGEFQPDLWPVMTGLPPARSLGTMYKRLSNSSDVAKGVTRAKTGTLREVIGLSGTIQTKDGGLVTFGILANQADSRNSTRRSVDDLMNSIANCDCTVK
jgi:D-alanyl-D-alanine carboxypeptidase/D-alanyl-D-alanine-endopeptidase (penicillin-binding protein 4)